MVAKRQPRIEVEDHGESGQWFVVYTAQGKPVLWTQDPDQAREKKRELKQ